MAGVLATPKPGEGGSPAQSRIAAPNRFGAASTDKRAFVKLTGFPLKVGRFLRKMMSDKPPKVQDISGEAVRQLPGQRVEDNAFLRSKSLGQPLWL